MATFISKLKRVCKDSNRHQFWLTITWFTTWNPFHILWAFGVTPPDHSLFASVLMILESSMNTKLMQITSWLPFVNSILSPLIGLDNISAGSISIGTTTKATLIFPCQVILRKSYSNFNVKPHRPRKRRRTILNFIDLFSLTIGSLPPVLIFLPSWIKPEKQGCRPSLDLSCIMPGLSTAIFFQHSTPLLVPNHLQLNVQYRNATTYWTTLPLIHTQYDSFHWFRRCLSRRSQSQKSGCRLFST